MRIKHLLLILLFISINIAFIPIYKYGYRIGTWDPNILDNHFNKSFVGLFMLYLTILVIGIIAGIVIFDLEYNGFKKIGKLLNKKIL